MPSQEEEKRTGLMHSGCRLKFDAVVLQLAFGLILLQLGYSSQQVREPCKLRCPSDLSRGRVSLWKQESLRQLDNLLNDHVGGRLRD